MPVKFYGLLYLSPEKDSVVNSHVMNFEDQVSVYLDCAISLAKSLSSRGISFILLTNNSDFLGDLSSSKAKFLQIKEIDFFTEVPSDAKFYSAHFKLDVFRYLASLNEDYVGLCDLDMICINDMPSSLSNNIKKKIPMCYDISDQVIPAYGHDTITQSLKMIHGLDGEGRWTGGEFIAGSSDFFQILSKEADHLFENYKRHIKRLHHVGDEAFTSAALEIIRMKGIYIADAGTLGIVGRYWSSKCLHPQKPIEYFHRSFLLHLPADKRFLAGLANQKNSEPVEFKIQYEKYRKSVKLTSSLKGTIRKLLSVNLASRQK